MEYLCHKWPRICFTCHKHFSVLSSFMTYLRVCSYINTTGATGGAGSAYPSGAHEFSQVFSGVCVTRSLVLCVCFVDRCLSFCTFSFHHCVVCPSTIYWFWLPLWYLQTRLKYTLFSNWIDKYGVVTMIKIRPNTMCYNSWIKLQLPTIIKVLKKPHPFYQYQHQLSLQCKIQINFKTCLKSGL